MTDVSYLVPASPVSFEQTIKQSRFICSIGRIETEHQVRLEVDRLRGLHPRADHICWAYIAGPPECATKGMSDAGEPRGTAGRPMLTVLSHSGLGEVYGAVIRYFGGIKLGKGGLIRAYTSSVQQALVLLETFVIQPMLHFRLDLDYNLLALIEPLLEQSGTQIVERCFGEGVSLDLLIPCNGLDELQKQIARISGGALRLEPHKVP
jgi:uncharacterized YigZ family protein